MVAYALEFVAPQASPQEDRHMPETKQIRWKGRQTWLCRGRRVPVDGLNAAAGSLKMMCRFSVV
jgi:hypothetical protein